MGIKDRRRKGKEGSHDGSRKEEYYRTGWKKEKEERKKGVGESKK